MNLKFLTKSQKKVILAAKQGKNIFIEGVAGTGKTFLLKSLAEITERTVYLYASTGIAALNLGGVTVSSSIALSLFLYDQTDDEIRENNKWEKYPKNSIIVIDEICLLSEEQFRQIDVGLRCKGERKKPFGGFQIIVAGDFKQMPSVGWGNSLQNSEILKHFYFIKLNENVRQKEDQEFFNILQKIRENGICKETEIFIKKNHNKKIENENAIKIVANRSLMDKLNANVKCPDGVKEYHFYCEEEDQDKSYSNIKVWQGMPVIITKNSMREGYCNGETGIILDFIDEKIKIKKDNGVVVFVSLCEKKYITTVQNDDFEIKKIEKSYLFMPILPANYLSIRRCQGLTLQKGILHASILDAKRYNKKDWISIQYVALSRFENTSQFYMAGF